MSHGKQNGYLKTLGVFDAHYATIRKMKKTKMGGSPTTWNFYANSDAWQKANGITRDDLIRIERELDKRPPTIRDIQILLSFGLEIELEYRNVKGFACSYWTAYNIHSRWNGKERSYENEDLDGFAEYAVLGPYLLKDVIAKCKIEF